MSNFQVAVAHYMKSPVQMISGDASVEEARERLEELKISSLAVADSAGVLSGVISMTDLIHLGRMQAGSRSESALLTLPDRQVDQVMTSNVVTAEPTDAISQAAQKMIDGHIHRVFVEENDKLVGVLSTRDVMLAIRDKRLRQPIQEWMSSPVFTVRADEPISIATERLENAHVTGLVVLEDDWPVGLFTQREALHSRDLKRETHVEEVMSSAMLVLNQKTPLHRAAAQVASLHVRRVIAVDDHRKIAGILTGLDFAKVATD